MTPTNDEIDARIDAWHAAHQHHVAQTDRITLPDALGWTREEFNAWLHDPAQVPSRALPAWPMTGPGPEWASAGPLPEMPPQPIHEPGFYWVCIRGGEPRIAQWFTQHGPPGEWWTPKGTYYSSRDVVVLSARLVPPRI